MIWQSLRNESMVRGIISMFFGKEFILCRHKLEIGILFFIS